MSSLPEYFADRQTRIIALIRELVERETTSREAARLGEIARFVAGLLQPLSESVDLFEINNYGMHLRARLNFGHERNSSESPQHILVIGHLDTVWPVGTLARLPFKITAEGTAHGPGIFDMKSGIAVLIEALRAMIELKLTTRHPVTLLLTCDEEIGSKTSRDLIEAEAKNAVAALVLEPPMTGGIVKTSRKGIGGFTIKTIGRAAHAGLDPHKGINAIIELAHQSLRLNELNDYERGITINVGTVTGGTTSNVIPAEAVAKVDLRFWTIEDGLRVEEFIKKLKPVVEGAELEVSGGINRPPMIRSEGNANLYYRARELAAEMGFDLQEGSVGGGSDGNFTAALGVPTLDGLGVDGAGAHAEHEHIILADIPRCAALITRLLQMV